MTHHINGWRWSIDDPNLLEPWFANLADSVETGLVKRNSERDVFRVVAGGREFHVKHSHPTSLLQRARSFLKPKLASEYESAKLLDGLGVPVVKAVGWGSKGSESILMTESVPGAVDARTHWFATASGASESKRVFLAGFADFLKRFIESGVRHPDFHPGNILVSLDDAGVPSFLLVDVYGVRQLRRIDDETRLDALSIVGAFRGEMSDVEGEEFISHVLGGNALSVDAAELWRRVLEREAVKSDRLWRKREARILSDPRYSRLVKIDNGQCCRIRMSLAGEPLLDAEEVAEALENSGSSCEVAVTGGGVAVRTLVSREEAAKLWMRSSLLEIHRLPSKRVVGWIENVSGEDVIFVECDIRCAFSYDELRKRYSIAGLEHSLF